MADPRERANRLNRAASGTQTQVPLLFCAEDLAAPRGTDPLVIADKQAVAFRLIGRVSLTQWDAEKGGGNYGATGDPGAA